MRSLSTLPHPRPGALALALSLALAGCHAGSDPGSAPLPRLASSASALAASSASSGPPDMADIAIEDDGHGHLLFTPLPEGPHHRTRAEMEAAIFAFQHALHQAMAAKSARYSASARLDGGDERGDGDADEDNSDGDSAEGSGAHDQGDDGFDCSGSVIVVCKVTPPATLPPDQLPLPPGPDPRPWWCTLFGLGCDDAAQPGDPAQAAQPQTAPQPQPAPTTEQEYEDQMNDCLHQYERDMDECSAYYGVFGVKTWLTCRNRAAEDLAACQSRARDNHKESTP